MGACCNEHNCKRKMRYRIRVGPFSGRWMLISRYTLRPNNLLVAIDKHDIHDELVAALISEGWTPPPERET
jgi:hypothetical protein